VSPSTHAVNAPRTRTGWAGTWGLPGDGRSKVARRAKTIRAEYLAEYDGGTPLAARRLTKAALYAALAEQVIDTLGTDPKASTRAATRLESAALKLLVNVPRKTPLTADPLAAVRDAVAEANKR